jgi:carboxymethylenebutenolidase
MSPRSQEIKQSGLFGFLAQPDTPTKAGIVVLPTIFGVHAFARGYAETLARAGLAAAVWDHYEGLPLTTDYEESKNRARTLTDPKMHEAIKAWIDYMLSELQLTSIGVIGFCMGGRYAPMVATRDKRIKACAAVYPSIENPRQPQRAEDALALAAEITCPALVVQPGHDHVASPGDLCRAQGDLEQALGAHDLAVLSRRRARLHASQCAAGEPAATVIIAATGRFSPRLLVVTRNRQVPRDDSYKLIMSVEEASRVPLPSSATSRGASSRRCATSRRASSSRAACNT